MATENYQKKLVDELAANFKQTELVFLVRWFIKYKNMSANPEQWTEYSQWEEIAFQAAKELYNDQLTYEQYKQYGQKYFTANIEEAVFLQMLQQVYRLLIPFPPVGMETARLYFNVFSTWKNQTIRKQHPYGSLKDMITKIIKQSEQRPQIITEEIPEFLFEQFLEGLLPKGFTICKYGLDGEELESLPYKIIGTLSGKNYINVSVLPHLCNGTENSSLLMLLPKKMQRDELYVQDVNHLETFLNIIGRRKQFDQIEYNLYCLVSKLFPGERLISFVPEDLLYATATKSFRDWLQDISVIKGIISIPSHALLPHTHTKVSLIIIDKEYNSNRINSDVYIAKANKLSELEAIITSFYEMGAMSK